MQFSSCCGGGGAKWTQFITTQGSASCCCAAFALNLLLSCSAFNNILSNVGHMMLGFLFLLIVLRRDILHRRAMEMKDIYILVGSMIAWG